MMTERFRGQLSFDLKVAPGLEAVEVPRLLLQPLVENALRHGLPDGRGNLTVDVARQGTKLLYTISDDGVGIDDTRIKPGTGLSNVARRLELLFPGAHTFALAAASPHGNCRDLELSGGAVDSHGCHRRRRAAGARQAAAFFGAAAGIPGRCAGGYRGDRGCGNHRSQTGCGLSRHSIGRAQRLRCARGHSRHGIAAHCIHHRLLGVCRSSIRCAGARLSAEALRSRAILAQHRARQDGIGGSGPRRSRRARAPCARGHAGAGGADQANPDTRSSAGLLHCRSTASTGYRRPATMWRFMPEEKCT